MIETAGNERKAGRSGDLLLELYSGLLADIWETVSALIGETILELLFSLAVDRLGDKYPFLYYVRVSEEGFSLDGVREASRILPAREVHQGFQGLITQLFHLFSALAEGVISRELFPKVLQKIREAERIVSQSRGNH